MIFQKFRETRNILIYAKIVQVLRYSSGCTSYARFYLMDQGIRSYFLGYKGGKQKFKKWWKLKIMSTKQPKNKNSNEKNDDKAYIYI